MVDGHIKQAAWSPVALVVVEGALCPRHHGLVGAHEGHAPVVHHVAVVKVPAELQLRLPARHPLGVQLLPHPAQLLGVREPVDGALLGDRVQVKYAML